MGTIRGTGSLTGVCGVVTALLQTLKRQVIPVFNGLSREQGRRDAPTPDSWGRFTWTWGTDSRHKTSRKPHAQRPGQAHQRPARTADVRPVNAICHGRVVLTSKPWWTETKVFGFCKNLGFLQETAGSGCSLAAQSRCVGSLAVRAHLPGSDTPSAQSEALLWTPAPTSLPQVWALCPPSAGTRGRGLVPPVTCGPCGLGSSGFCVPPGVSAGQERLRSGGAPPPGLRQSRPPAQAVVGHVLEAAAATAGPPSHGRPDQAASQPQLPPPAGPHTPPVPRKAVMPTL